MNPYSHMAADDLATEIDTATALTKQALKAAASLSFAVRHGCLCDEHTSKNEQSQCKADTIRKETDMIRKLIRLWMIKTEVLAKP